MFFRCLNGKGEIIMKGDGMSTINRISLQILLTVVLGLSELSFAQPEDANVLMYGQVLTGMNPDDLPNFQKSIMPMVWTRQIKRDSGKISRVIMSTIGAAQDMESEDLRRLYLNCIYWALGLESKIPEKADVNYIDRDWKASPFGGGKFQKGFKPSDFAIKHK